MNVTTKVDADAVPRVERGWGYELWIENIPEYCGKLLHVEVGKRCSLHFHMSKRETMYVASGVMRIVLIDPLTARELEQVLYPGDKIMIPPGQVHQICNASKEVPLELFEFSTTHDELDSFRVRKGD